VVFIGPFFWNSGMVMRLVLRRILPFVSVDRYGHFGGTSYLVVMLVRTYRTMQHHRSKLLHKCFQYSGKRCIVVRLQVGK